MKTLFFLTVIGAGVFLAYQEVPLVSNWANTQLVAASEENHEFQETFQSAIELMPEDLVLELQDQVALLKKSKQDLQQQLANVSQQEQAETVEVTNTVLEEPVVEQAVVPVQENLVQDMTVTNDAADFEMVAAQRQQSLMEIAERMELRAIEW